MNNNEFGSKSIISGASRRKFVKTSIIGAISVFGLPLAANELFAGKRKLAFDLSLDVPAKLHEGGYCYTHPRAGIIPGKGMNGLPRVVMTMTRTDLSGSDIFRATHGIYTNDLGRTWTAPEDIESLSPRFEMIDGVNRPVALSDFWPGWHNRSGKLLGTGHTVAYTPEWRVTDPRVTPRPRHTSYSYYDQDKNTWAQWKKMEMPDKIKFSNSGAGSTQRYDKNDGTILLPISIHDYQKQSKIVTVVNCHFSGKDLIYMDHGNELSINDKTRGLGEPSLTFFNEEYFLTIRNDNLGFVTRSPDGLNFSSIEPWKFDDGTDLGSYNTQTHWVTHSDGLFLVYTRRGANNDHVPRNRAPLFMAQVDPERLCVIRETERILMPERGAKLGNFGVTHVSSHETWVTDSEWMVPKRSEHYGSDGSIYVASIHWNKINRFFIT